MPLYQEKSITQEDLRGIGFELTTVLSHPLPSCPFKRRLFRPADVISLRAAIEMHFGTIAEHLGLLGSAKGEEYTGARRGGRVR